MLNEDRRKAKRVIEMGCVIIRAIVAQMLAVYLWSDGNVQAMALSEQSAHNKESDSELVFLKNKRDRHKSYSDYNDDVVSLLKFNCSNLVIV